MKTVGVCAPSDGLTNDKEIIMCENSKKKLEEIGYKVIYSDSCFKSINGRSNVKEIRAKEFMDTYNNSDITISISGGEYEMEILKFIDFNKLKSNKLFCGASDNSYLCFLLTTIKNIPTVYGHNFYELGIKHKVINNFISFINGNLEEQKEIKDVSLKDYSWKETNPITSYTTNYKNTIKYYNCNNLDVSGIMIGGLLENLSVICGTKYDNVINYIDNNKDNGLIWYFDICIMPPEDVKRALWGLKEAGWFNYSKAILFARPIVQNDSFGISYQDNIYDELKDLNIPIIMDINLGHIPPSYSMYNGKIANINNKDNIFNIKYKVGD